MQEEDLKNFHKDPEMLSILKDTAVMVVRRAYANMCAGRVESDAIGQLIFAAKEIQAHVAKVEEQIKSGVPVELINWAALPERDAPREG